MDKQRHKWEQVEVPDNLKDTFKKKAVCTRGDCKCERLTSYHKGIAYNQYTRNHQLYNEVPECYGDVPLNEQGIDD